MHSISTSTPLGSCLTATQLRAGLWVNHLLYSSFMACTRFMSKRLFPPLVSEGGGSITYRKVGHVSDEHVHLDDLLNA